jgi:hypothetical protein
VPCRSERAFIITKKTGTKISTFIVEVIMPPTIGAAIGFITSDPTPVSHRIGTRLARTAATVPFPARRPNHHPRGRVLMTLRNALSRSRGRP